MTIVDVGEGDCILVQTPSGRAMLIDGGGDRSMDREHNMVSSDIGDRVVVPFLRREGVDDVNVMVITHPHGDHVGGLGAVVREIQTDAVLDGTTLRLPVQTYRDLLQSASSRHIAYSPARRGETIDFGDGVRAEVLNPPVRQLVYGTGFDDKTINNYSAVLKLTYGKTSFLLDGDAEQEAEQNILQAYPLSYLKADVLKAGHHGSRNASCDAWLDTVSPHFAAICCGKNNEFGHPHAETLQRLTNHNIVVYRTDNDGSFEFDSDGQTVTERPAQ